MKIPLFKIYWDEKDIDAIKRVISFGMYWTTGPLIEEFESRIAQCLGTKHCIVFNSGGSAIFALMRAYGFKAGDEIIVPSFTFIATAYAPLYVGAKPVFAEIEEESFGLDPKDVEQKITEKTKAIIPIHYGGTPCKIDELKKLADKHNLILIEDAAESFSAKVDNQYLGSFGDSAILSFCQNKIFTTGEGGAVVTNNNELYYKLKLLRSYGREDGDYFSNSSELDYSMVGYNFRMPVILAALGLSQLAKVDKLIKLRREKIGYLNQGLNNIEEITILGSSESVYQLYTVRVFNNLRDKLMDYLTENGISTKIYFTPAHKYSVFKDYKDIKLPRTEALSSQVLSLPMYPDLSEQEMDYIIKTIKDFFKNL